MNGLTKEPDQKQPIVYVIDDDESVRTSLEDLLASVGQRAVLFASTEEFMGSERPDVPACLVLDVRMPGLSGLDFQEKMTRLGIEIPIVFITAHGDIPMSVRAMKAGAVEFLTKPFREQDLLDAIQQGISRDRTTRREGAVRDELERRYATLTDGERDVMDLIVKGLLNKQVAGRLGLSEVTVKVRRGQLMRKMGADSLADLVRFSERIHRAEEESLHHKL